MVSRPKGANDGDLDNSIPVAFISPLASMLMWGLPFIISNYILHKVYRLDKSTSVA